MEQSLLIYFFSGTGNARNVANWFTDVASDLKIRAEAKDLAKIDRKKIQQPPTGSLVGFISPHTGSTIRRP
jgi:flavodoxin